MDLKFEEHNATEDISYPDQVFVSGEDKKLSQLTSKYHLNVGRSLQQDTTLDHHLREEQQSKVMSGSARYRAMQVCIYYQYY